MKFIIGPVTMIFFIIIVVVYVKMYLFLKRRADNMASMTNSPSTMANAAMDNMRKLAYFITGMAYLCNLFNPNQC